MTGWLVDTNVVSELVAPAPEPRVVAFLRSSGDLWMSVIVIHELHCGLRQLPVGRRRDQLTDTLSVFVGEYAGRILPVSLSVADRAADLRAQARRSGRTVNLADALIAGTALVHRLGVATRNTSDFEDHGIALTNPWHSPPELTGHSESGV